MTLPIDQQTWLDFVGGTIELGVNWLVQSSLLIAVGLLIGHLLRSRGSAVQSAVYRTTLVAALVCPLATWGLALAGVTGWSFSMPAAYSLQLVAAGDSPAMAPTEPPPDTFDAPPAAAFSPPTGEPPVATDNVAESSVDTFDPNFVQPLEQPALDASSLPAVAATGEPPVATEAWQLQIQWFGIVAVVFGALWFTVGLVLLNRLVLAWWRLAKLRRRAYRADQFTLATCRQLAESMRISPPEVLHSPFLPSPCLAGLRNPAVLLPESEVRLPLRDVLIHELAHLARRDCHWNLVRRVTTSVFFFQPLLWILSRRIEATAEEVCDDYVVTLGGNRHDYAHRLVDLAELSVAPIAAAGVGIVSLRSMLAQRVARILDSSRSLSTRVGHALLALVLLGGLMATLLAGLVGVGPRTTVAESDFAETESKEVAEAVEWAPEGGSDDDDVTQAADYVVNSQALARTDGANDDDPDAVVEYAGKVLTPDGQPAASAKIFLVYHVVIPDAPLAPTWKPIGTTDAAGKFRIALAAKDLSGNEREWSAASLVATAEGFGFAWTSAAMHETSGKYLAKYRERLADAPPEFRAHLEKMLAQAGQPLRLVADEPVTGRIVDINGQGVAGARLTLLEVWSGFEDDLTAWLEATKAEKADYYSARAKTPRAMNGPQVRSLVAPAVTDADGRFTMRGIGRERIAELLVTGPNIQSEKIFARTQAGETIELLQEWRSPDLGKYTYYPAEFTYVAGPSRPIVGLVRDRQSQQPLAGVLIKSQRRHGHMINGWGQDFVQAFTGADGRYRLDGMPIGDENRIAAIAPSDRAYLPMSQPADTRASEKEVEVNFDLPPAVWVEGQVTDKQSDEGLPGWVHYYIHPDNPTLAKIGRPGNVDLRDRYQANDKGRFRIPVLPGDGVIGFMAFDHEKYPRGAGSMSIKGATRADGREIIKTEPIHLIANNYHIVAEISPAADAEKIDVKLELDSGGSLKGRVVDPEGKPVTGFYYCGQLAKFATWDMARGNLFDVVGYQPNQPRPIYVVHPERNLAGSYLLKGDPPQELTVTLQPAGKVTGRVLSDDGEPLGNLMLLAWQPGSLAPSPKMSLARAETAAPLPPNARNQSQWVTDADGRFAIDGLVPGVEYRLKVTDRESMSRTFPPARMPRVDGGLEPVIVVEPGQTLDLGAVRVMDDAKLEAQARESKTNETPSPSPSPADGGGGSAINGRVTRPDGEPIAGADVAIIGMTHAVSRGGDFGSHRSETCCEAKTDDDGRFQFIVSDDWQKSHRFIAVIASAEGVTVGWKQLSFDEPSEEVSLTLKPEEVVQGRLIDIEGRPAAGVKMAVRSVMTRALPLLPMATDGVGYRDNAKAPAAWPAAIVTDAEGRFAVHHIGGNQGVMLDVEANDRFAPQEISLNTGQSEQRGERDGTYRPLVKNVKPGEEAVLPLAPAQIFEGVVRYEDTGEPAPNARLTIWASQQQQGGSMISVAGKADSQGRYRINPKPGVRFGVTAYAPDGAPYLTRRMPEVRWEGGQTKKTIDVTLPRGVMVRGKVVETESLAPVPKATVQYVPEEINNPHAKDDILTGWQGIQLANDEGEFPIVVLPGPGRLLVHGPQGEFVLQEIPGRELSHGTSGGWRNYAHAVERLEPESGTEVIDVTITLMRGEKISGQIVDEQGKPVNGAFLITRLNVRPTTLWWRGDGEVPMRAPGGRFELSK